LCFSARREGVLESCMTNSNLVLVPCSHGGDESGRGCLACDGSGFVKVVTAADGKPCECEHASANGRIEKCTACLGSGWAGVKNG
jgi:hypothetical protein